MNLFYLVFLALLVVTLINYIRSFTAVVLFFIFYTKPDGCSINKFFISFNMLFCLVASFLSVLPKVQVQQCFSKWGAQRHDRGAPHHFSSWSLAPRKMVLKNKKS